MFYMDRIVHTCCIENGLTCDKDGKKTMGSRMTGNVGFRINRCSVYQNIFDYFMADTKITMYDFKRAYFWSYLA